MIRRYLHRRWVAPLTPEERLLRLIFNVNRDTWINHYVEWVVDRYGTSPGAEPWYTRPVTRFVVWLDEWRETLAMRKP